MELHVNDSSDDIGAITTTPHLLTAHVQSWPNASTSPTPDGFVPIVSRGGKAILAVRNEPVRQVWLNGNVDAWSSTSDFVVFFADAFDWLGAKHQPADAGQDADVSVESRPAPAGDLPLAPFCLIVAIALCTVAAAVFPTRA